jgi:phosphoribosylformimino-5-aminoimidazole carboxamide ribotide isomerase
VIVLPSIDIESGRGVKRERGLKGSGLADLGDPVALAARWKEAGARALHVVDLDGAEGTGGNRSMVLRLLREAGLPVQVSGGVRTTHDLEELIGAGAWKVLLSTQAWTDPAWLKDVAGRFGAKVGLSLDVADGRVRIRGWKESGPAVPDALAIAADAGVGWVLYTDVAREGQVRGIDRDAVREMRRSFEGDLFVAGGIRAQDEIRALASLGVDGVVVGRALYDGTLTAEVLREGWH